MARVANNAEDYAKARLNIFFPASSNGTSQDGDLTGQCVTLNKWFLAEMTSVPSPFAARGDARYVGQTLVAQGHAVKVPYSERRRGDFAVFEYGVYGHIGVLLDSDRIFEENVNVAGVQRKVVAGSYVYSSRIGRLSESWRSVQATIYRIKTYTEASPKPEPPKEVVEMVSLNGLQVLYKFYLGTDVSEYGMKNRLGKQTFDQAAEEIRQSDAFKQRLADIEATQGGLVRHLPAAVQNIVKLPEQVK